MALERHVAPEWLDELPASDWGAIRSRQDLQRLNFLMGHAGLAARLLKRGGASHPIRRVVELGGGDGTFLLRLARRIVPRARRFEAMVVDRLGLVSAETRQEFTKMGWTLHTTEADIFEWLAQTKPQTGTAMLANLFLHHFEDGQLRALLAEVERKADLFVACEPRRAALALGACRLLGLIGCNAVTRHDAPASVRAGFARCELSTLWPSDSCWHLEEGNAGLFSHFLLARRERP